VTPPKERKNGIPKWDAVPPRVFAKGEDSFALPLQQDGEKP
jgi:hypothetical protein